jgi:hypothetical protein
MPKSKLSHLSYANVTATLALVFAMSGGALAANHYLVNSTEQINPKVLKKLKGATGTTGAVGKRRASGQRRSAGQRRPRRGHSLAHDDRRGRRE